MNGLPINFTSLTDDKAIINFILDSAHVTNSVLTSKPDLPDTLTLCEALASVEHDQWHAAILEELAAIQEVGTWELVNPNPSIQNIIGCHFILQKKRGASGEVTCFKVWLVAQGFSQNEGIDFSETFTPVVKSTSLCRLLPSHCKFSKIYPKLGALQSLQ